MRTITFFCVSILLSACSSGGNGSSPKHDAGPSTHGSSTNGGQTGATCDDPNDPTCNTETGVEEECAVGADCESGVCADGVCQEPTSRDGVQNGDETDVDCGGTTAPSCADGLKCVAGSDCTSKVCTAGVCQKATSSDGVQNGDESDVDCGGTKTGAQKCATGKKCNAHADCVSDGCGYDGKCAAGRSCTQHLGGDTCGVGEIGEAGAVHESCCLQAPIAGSAARVDKYLVTAGRMRAFIERLNGNVLAYVSGLPASNWDQKNWNSFVPSDIDDANTQLGPYWNKKSCAPGSFNGHTYYTPPDPNDLSYASSFTQTDMDPKALNCVGWHLANAFCQWDGGRLPSHNELKNIATNNSGTSWPLVGGNAPNQAKADDRWSHYYNYGYPGPEPFNAKGSLRDVAWQIPPPGRFPGATNANGVADAVGNMLPWNSDKPYYFTWTGSWDDHNRSLANGIWTGVSSQSNGYFAIGIRCAHD
ncbi:MAG: hypothetical protein FWD73_13615 [Polyangiaceae bacterium]|nr:hypothetical protein [Polyangiaceae bacterium]